VARPLTEPGFAPESARQGPPCLPGQIGQQEVAVSLRSIDPRGIEAGKATERARPELAIVWRPIEALKPDPKTRDRARSR
jgi:hypothetical protein